MILLYFNTILIQMTQNNNLNVKLSNSQLINLSKIHLHKIGQSGGFLGRLLGPLLKTRLLLMKKALTPLAKSVLISLRLH